MRLRAMLLIGVLSAGCVTTACTTASPTLTAPTPPGATTCDPTLARWAIGERASSGLLEAARVAAGAAVARFLRPNQVITMEYLGSRLNLNLDAQDIVRSVTCG